VIHKRKKRKHVGCPTQKFSWRIELDLHSELAAKAWEETVSKGGCWKAREIARLKGVRGKEGTQRKNDQEESILGRTKSQI